MQMSTKVLLGLLLFAVGFWLSQRPSCKRGCKTIAEHLLTDGLDDAIAALFA